MANLFPKDNYEERLDAYIRKELNRKLKPNHPCDLQIQKCLKGDNCPLIGLPADICPYYVRGRCHYTQKDCPNRHVGLYSNIYKKAKAEFISNEQKPRAVIQRVFKRFMPYVIFIFTLVFNYLIKKIIDSVMKKIV